MGVEAGVGYIDDLVVTNPESTDVVAEGDDHIRLTKAAVKGSFTSLGREAVTKTAAEINDLVDKSSNQSITGEKIFTSPILNSPTINTATINGSLQLQPAVPTTSGTAVNIANVPSWVKRITLMLNGVSTNGNSDYLVQIGDSVGIETTGYNSSLLSSSLTSSSMTESGAGYLSASGVLAGQLTNGSIILSLQNSSSSTWVAEGALQSPGNLMCSIVGLKSLSTALTQLRLTTVSGLDIFDAGSISATYE